jgi:hypothetical protein
MQTRTYSGYRQSTGHRARLCAEPRLLWALDRAGCGRAQLTRSKFGDPTNIRFCVVGELKLVNSFLLFVILLSGIETVAGI